MVNDPMARLQSPRNTAVDLAALMEFENGLDLFVPEKSAIPCQVLGYGETSTVFKILDPRLESLAFKRMSIFKSLDELDPYLAAFQEYQRVLVAEIGLQIPDNGYAAFLNQTGLGRCGAVWGIDTYGVVPDIIVAGKGLSGGIYPITATSYREYLNPFVHANPFIHISTFGGAEVGCYAALEVLAILEEPGFLAHVRDMAEVFEGGFRELRQQHAGILVGTPQRGLMMGLRLADPRFGPLFTRIGFDAGLLAIYANNDPSVVQLLPPLIIEAEQARQVLRIIDGMLGTLAGLVS